MRQHVQWSPDGAPVMFVAFARDGSRLMIAPAAGGRALPVDPEAKVSEFGVWSPDGAQIVYRGRVGDEHQIVTGRVGTSGQPGRAAALARRALRSCAQAV